MLRSADTLPDGRVDHRNHARDTDWSGHGFICLDCTDEDGEDVPWTVPYDRDGYPIPAYWREMPRDAVLSLCGVDRRCTGCGALATVTDGVLRAARPMLTVCVLPDGTWTDHHWETP